MTRTPSDAGIVVFGAPRSGTTLLRRLLDAHSRIACPGETNLLAACARFLRSETGAEDLDVGVLTGLGFAGVRESEVLDRLRTLAVEFLSRNARQQGKPRWAEKSAFDAFHIAAIEQLLGDDVQYIGLIRHGLDVVCSTREFCDKTHAYLFELHDYVRQYSRPLQAFAHVWFDIAHAIRELSERRPEQTVVVRYEDLVAEPEREMRRILEFLGEPWEPEILERALTRKARAGFADWKAFSKTQIDRSSVERWKSLSRSVIAELAAIVNPTLQSFGYDAVPSEPLTRKQAIQRYEMGMKLQASKQKKRPGLTDS